MNFVSLNSEIQTTIPMDNSISETELGKKEISRRDYKRMARIVIWLTLAILVVSVILIVRAQICVGKTGIGQLGSAIGGVTAPIVGFGGAILVYLSFLIQHQANEDLRKRQDVLEKKYQEKENFNQLQKLLEVIVSQKERFELIFSESQRIYEGSIINIPDSINEIFDRNVVSPSISSSDEERLFDLLVELEEAEVKLSQMYTWLYLLDELELNEQSRHILISQFSNFDRDFNIAKRIESIAVVLNWVLDKKEKYLNSKLAVALAEKVNEFYFSLSNYLQVFDEKSIVDFEDYLK